MEIEDIYEEGLLDFYLLQYLETKIMKMKMKTYSHDPKLYQPFRQSNKETIKIVQPDSQDRKKKTDSLDSKLPISGANQPVIQSNKETINIVKLDSQDRNQEDK